MWVPQDLRPGRSNGFDNYYLSAVARLRDGLTLEAAQERAMALSQGFAEEHPETEGAFPRLVPLQEDVVGSTRQAMLWILAGAAGLVLLTACVNVANLLFARGLSQDRDLALPSALGSGRGRLITGILTENGLLAAAGGALGLAAGWAGLRALPPGGARRAPDGSRGPGGWSRLPLRPDRDRWRAGRVRPDPDPPALTDRAGGRPPLG